MGKKNIICIVLLILSILFIWGNSTLPGNVSMGISDKVVTDLGGTVTNSREDDKNAPTFFNSSNVRKLAHVLEFACLGGVAAVMVPLNKKRWPTVLLLGVSVAVLDETIQIFTNRTSAIKDVWIDFGGFLCGVIIGWVLLQCIQTWNSNRKSFR